MCPLKRKKNLSAALYEVHVHVIVDEAEAQINYQLREIKSK